MSGHLMPAAWPRAPKDRSVSVAARIGSRCLSQRVRVSPERRAVRDWTAPYPSRLGLPRACPLDSQCRSWPRVANERFVHARAGPDPRKNLTATPISFSCGGRQEARFHEGTNRQECLPPHSKASDGERRRANRDTGRSSAVTLENASSGARRLQRGCPSRTVCCRWPRTPRPRPAASRASPAPRSGRGRAR